MIDFNVIHGDMQKNCDCHFFVESSSLFRDTLICRDQFVVYHWRTIGMFDSRFISHHRFISRQYRLVLLQRTVPPFTNIVFTLIPAWINNHMLNNMGDEITYPFLNFNGCTVEV